LCTAWIFLVFFFLTTVLFRKLKEEYTIKDKSLAQAQEELRQLREGSLSYKHCRFISFMLPANTPTDVAAKDQTIGELSQRLRDSKGLAPLNEELARLREVPSPPLRYQILELNYFFFSGRSIVTTDLITTEKARLIIGVVTAGAPDAERAPGAADHARASRSADDQPSEGRDNI
jgi:hypothetical protein